MCLLGVKEMYVQEKKKKWQKTFWVKFALPYPALKAKLPPPKTTTATALPESWDTATTTGIQ